MRATPDSTCTNPEQRIANLERQLTKCKAERDEALAERDTAQRRLVERTAERDETLGQQTATSAVLRVINSSPGDLAPDALASNPLPGFHFREELDAIDAVIAGQGMGIFSDLLVGAELASGALVKVVDLALPGLGFYVAYVPNHPRQALIEAFAAWIRSAA